MKIAPRHLFEKSALLSITGPIAAGFVVAVGALAAIVWMGARALDASEIEKEQYIARGIIDRLKDGVGYTVLPQANWDDAYLTFQAPLDLDHVRSQIGPDALSVLDIEGLYVFDALNRPIYSVYEGVEFVDRIPPSLETMQAFAAAIREKLADRPHDFVSGVVSAHGVPHFVAGTFIAPTTPSLKRHALDGKIMIIEREVPWESIQMLGRAFALDDFDQSAHPSTARLTLYDPTGAMAAELAWTPKRPGDLAFRKALLPIMIVMAMLCVFSAHVLSNWLKLEQALKESRLHSAALEEAARTKSVLLAHLSHELRTPLNAIIGFAQLLRFGLLPCNKHGDYGRDIEAGGRRLLGIVDSVLELARLERGDFEPDIREMDVAAVLERAVASIRERVGEAGARVEITPGAQPLTLISDEQAVTQILVHLLDNAVKFSPPGTPVTIAARRAGGCVEIVIEDQGPGMSQDLCARAMMPFGAADNAFVQTGQGVGLGLTLSRALVQRLNATIEIASAEGAGTRVTVAFPGAETEAHPAMVKSEAA